MAETRWSEPKLTIKAKDANKVTYCTEPTKVGLRVTLEEAAPKDSDEPSPQEFYEANATNVCNVPRVGHPEDPSGWAGVRRASEARFVAGDALVMTLADAFDFAEKYKAADNQDSPLMRLREKIAEADYER